MSKKKATKLSCEEIEKWGEKLGEHLHLIYIDILCLQDYTNFWKNTSPPVDGKYVSIFNHFYRLFFDSMDIKIYKFFDARIDVMSLKNFFIKLKETSKMEEIMKNDVLTKIKSRRSNKIAHDNLILSLDPNKRLKHYEKNKQYLSEIVSFLKVVQSEFESVLSKHVSPSIAHYALGKSKESSEFKALLSKIFADI